MNLQTCRQISNMTQLQLAKETGVSQAELSKAEAGKILNVDLRRRVEGFFAPISVSWGEDPQDFNMTADELRVLSAAVTILIHGKELKTLETLCATNKKSMLQTAKNLLGRTRIVIPNKIKRRRK